MQDVFLGPGTGTYQLRMSPRAVNSKSGSFPLALFGRNRSRTLCRYGRHDLYSLLGCGANFVIA
jgi:hypothetical protein